MEHSGRGFSVAGEGKSERALLGLKDMRARPVGLDREVTGEGEEGGEKCLEREQTLSRSHSESIR